MFPLRSTVALLVFCFISTVVPPCIAAEDADADPQSVPLASTPAPVVNAIDVIAETEIDSECICDTTGTCDGGPFWRITGGALVLDRSTPDSLVLMQDTTDPTRNLNADDFNFSWQAGWEVSLVRELECGRGLEVRFFSIDSWNAATTAVTNSTLQDPLRINTSPHVNAPNVQTIDALYGTDLHSLELNYRGDGGPCWNWLAGFRYIELDEHLHADLNAGPQLFTYDIVTRNRMYGVQAGVDTELWSGGCWSVDGLLKAGLYHNSQGHTSVLDTGVVMQAGNNPADRATFMGELGLTATYDLTDHLAVVAGYDLLWLETVALASDQIPATNLFTGTGIAADGGVFFHGAIARLEYRR